MPKQSKKTQRQRNQDRPASKARAPVSVTAAERVARTVYGVVRHPRGTAAAGLTVIAFDRDDPGENRLGESTSDTDGAYRVTYADADYRRSSNERGGADVFVRVYDAAKQLLLESDTVRNA